MSQPVFHAPDHDHERCTADALEHAEVCARERAQRLTPIRRQVLEVLLESHKPLGAYEIMDAPARSARGRRRSRSTARSISCATTASCIGSKAATPSSPASTTTRRGDLVVFLICEHCGAVGEAASSGVADQLKAAARARGLHAEGAGDRDRRRLRALPAARTRAVMSAISRKPHAAARCRQHGAGGVHLLLLGLQPGRRSSSPSTTCRRCCNARSARVSRRLIVLGLMRLRGLPVTARDGTLIAGLDRRRCCSASSSC